MVGGGGDGARTQRACPFRIAYLATLRVPCLLPLKFPFITSYKFC